ncbi:MAG: hypothetical protein WBX15_11695 [Thermoanaerobaculia bacterium]
MATFAERLVEELAPYLGPFNSQVAVRTISRRVLNLAPDQLTETHLPALLSALEPMLKTMAGAPAAEKVLSHIRMEVH